ncbi:phosphoribosyltransferase domain-containing protein [Streptomyces sp. BE20]|uniref:phosphoribosyltransferase n=1 Tax=Streptomyces sp. BE20 TaxID=3002525 RepID=UPI002E783EC4|nr:phosphoribosyltransferase domain-containing protein [Streptomyces sp. BE20]MEE1823892.1 phosphoribosyltransferase domain-containing protein [Streptomyces sp. BE20]
MPVTVADRVFEHRRIWQLTQQAFLDAVDRVADYERAHRPDVVIGIARGGTLLAEYLARRLAVPAVIVHARHNTSDATRQPATGLVRLTSTSDALAGITPGSRLLLVDDICGSGATLHAVERWLTDNLRPGTVRTAVLCRNQGADFTPDTWGWDVADWVRFFWEPSADEPVEPLPLLTGLHHRTPTA